MHKQIDSFDTVSAHPISTWRKHAHALTCEVPSRNYASAGRVQ